MLFGKKQKKPEEYSGIVKNIEAELSKRLCSCGVDLSGLKIGFDSYSLVIEVRIPEESIIQSV